jgi:tripartite-type tricarboxylate transporter receptor subunit TctC
MAPAGTPRPVIQRLTTEVLKALRRPEARQRLALQGVEPLSSAPEAYGAYIASEITRWTQVVKQAGIPLG